MQMVNGQPGHLVLRVCLFEFLCCASVVDVDDLEVLVFLSRWLQILVSLVQLFTLCLNLRCLYCWRRVSKLFGLICMVTAFEVLHSCRWWL